MGNRFFTLTGYHALVRAHAVIAGITFLAVVPAAIFLMRFYGRNPRRAVRFHIWLQVLTLLLLTVAFVLGCFAVGPRRSLTNPHHGIGVAIYVLVWIQVIGGALVHRSEKRNRRLHIPLKAMIHHWLGRAIALLGIAQVALGLTLYGSPLFLFVLYAVFVFALVVLYFILEWLHERRKTSYETQHGSYVEEQVVRPEGHRHGGFGKLATAGAAGAGLAALWRRRSDKRQRRRHSESDVTGTGSASSYMYDEKYSEPAHKGWGRRILEVGAIGGGLAAAKKLFDRRRGHDDNDSEVGPYRPPLGGQQSVSSASMSRIEEGRPPPPRPITPTGVSPGHVRPSHPLAQTPMTPGSALRPSGDEYSYYTYDSSSPSRQGRHQTFRQAIAAGGAFFAVRQLFKHRREKKEERRENDLRNERVEQEKISRMNSAHRYTGDGTAPPRRMRHNRMTSQTASDVSSYIDGTAPHPGFGSSALPAAGVGAAAATALADRDRIRPVGTDPVIAPPGPASAMATDLPPAPPPHREDMHSSGSELYTTTSGRNRHRHHLRDEAAAAMAGGALGAAATDAARRRQSGLHTDSVESPPVSIHVQTQDNGRKVTLRRLTEDEAAAKRADRRRERRDSRRRRNSSLSSGSGAEALGVGTSANQRWRRTEAIEAQQAAADAAAAHGASNYPTPPPPGTQQALDPHTGQPYHIPAPPPIPGSSSNLGPATSITSPGTETSGATEYANNRRRRRAERAQAKLAREGRAGGGNTVDFT